MRTEAAASGRASTKARLYFIAARSLSFQQIPNKHSGMERRVAVQIFYLLSAGGAGGYQNLARFHFSHRGQQTPVRDGDGDVVVLLAVPEAARHAAAACIEIDDR